MKKFIPVNEPKILKEDILSINKISKMDGFLLKVTMLNYLKKNFQNLLVISMVLRFPMVQQH